MEELSVLLFVVVIILVVSLRSYLRKRLDVVDAELHRLREMVAKPGAGTAGTTLVPPVVTPEAITPVAPAAPAVPEHPERWSSGFRVEKEDCLTEKLESLLKNVPPAVQETAPAAESPVEKETDFFLPKPPAPPPVRTPPPPPKPSFLERNPDLEKFIGENLISKIGIAILVLAIGFFVKYAIDNDWIGPVGRVGIGIVCGAILIAVAHRLRNSYNAFSSVLVGGGLAIFYFTIALAYHQFHLFSQTASFIIMVVITAFSVVLSQLYNRQELAVIALVGGFATPFMVSNGSNNYQSLFVYLIILNAGLLGIAYNKAWRILNALAFVFTVVLFGAWLFTLSTNGLDKTGANAAAFRSGFGFATVFYLLFFLINIAHNIRENKKFLASDFGILLANTGLYFSAGLYCLTAMHAGEYKGLFTAAMGIFNLGASFLLFRNRKADSNILYLLIGVTLSFISLTAPIQLNGHNITLFWASESVLLYWLYQKSRISLIRLSSRIVWAAMVVSLVMDWLNVYGSYANRLPVIANRGFITTVFAAAASCLLCMLGRKDAVQPPLAGMHIRSNWFGIAGALLFFAAGAFEINHQFSYYYPGTDLYMLYELLYTFAFILVFNFITAGVFFLPLPWYVRAGLQALCVLFYLICIQQTFDIQAQMLQQQQHTVHFAAHWLGAVLLAVILYRFIAMLRNNLPAIETFAIPLTWIVCIIIIIYLSVEVQLLANSLFYSASRSLPYIQRVYSKAGLPILWGLCSFGFMWLGMTRKFRMLRVISLTLFSIILIKLFVFDIRNIPVAGKIAAFFSLGVLLLVVSFMYQRLKKIITEDEKKPVA